MSSPSSFLLTRVLLNFEAEREEIISDLSAAAFSDDGSLWVGSDEMIGVERLSLVGCHNYGEHQRFFLQDYVNLFNTDDEMDIEGMDFADGYLWLTGSHSTKRKKPKKDDLEENLERMATITEHRKGAWKQFAESAWDFVAARVPFSPSKGLT